MCYAEAKIMPAAQAKELITKEIEGRRIAAPRETIQWRRAAPERLHEKLPRRLAQKLICRLR
jgi:hypothetical protein